MWAAESAARPHILDLIVLIDNLLSQIRSSFVHNALDGRRVSLPALFEP